MTTAYTSLLGLALPVTGELSGTWGDTVNNSITSLLDTAIAGTTTLSSDADVTLSTTTGASNQARQSIILWTASGTVTRTITAPAQSKIYTIINRSSTQSIKIVGVGPTTGVTVKSGATVTVAWNGLDFVEISVSTLYPTVTISGNMDNGTTDNSLNNAPTVKSAVTTLASVYLSNPSTEAASFTLTDLVGFRAEQGTFGASSTVTNQYGFYANSDLTGATNNYGLYSAIAATAAVTISSVNGTGSTVTVDTATAHGLNTGDKVIIAGISNATMTAGSYNGGPYTITKVDADTFTYSSTATSSAAVTSGGNVVKANNWNVYAAGTGNNWFGGPIVQSVSSTLPALRITQTGTGDSFVVEDSANPDSTPFVIDSGGNVVLGTTTVANSTVSGTPQFSQAGTAAQQTRNAFSRWDASASGFAMQFGKSRSGTLGTYGIVSSGDSAGQLQFFGDDGTAFVQLATIGANVDGTPGTNDMPGRLVFSTTADGASTPTERMRIDNTGQTKFSYNTVVEVTDNTNAALRITQLGTGNALLVEDSANPDSTPFVVDASGNIYSGYTTAFNYTSVGGGSLRPRISIAGTDADTSTFGASLFANTASGPTVVGAKSRNATVGNHTVVQSNDALLNIIAEGSDGTGFIRAATIIAAVDGTPGTNDMPGRLVFSTTADGASTPTERMRIDSAGYVGIGTDAPAYSVDIQNGNATTGDVLIRVKANPTAGQTDADATLVLDGGSVVATTITAGSFVVGTRYRIATVGTTDFTLIGASANTVGVSFIATGAGTGTGTAVTLNSGEAEIYFKNTTYDRAYIGWNEDGGYLSIDANNGGNDGIIRFSVDGGTGTVQVYGSNNGLVNGFAAKNTLRFLDSDTSTVANQPIGVIDFYTSDTSTGGTGVAAYIMSAAAGTSGGGDLRFGTAGNTSSGSPAERMRIDAATGNVGILNTAPACALDVTGGIQTSRTAVTSPAATDGNIFSGTYTPTLTNTTNVSSSTAQVCHYMRVGNVVTVSGRVTIDPTATGLTTLGMTLPIASNITSVGDANGTFASPTSEVGCIFADTTNDRATFQMTVQTDVANTSYRFTFTYMVI